MADEYYYVYTNAVAMRKIILYSSRLYLWHEYQKSIDINPTGIMPDNQIVPQSVTLANLKGESESSSWTNTPTAKWQAQPEDKPEEACIEVINLKSTFKSFLISLPERKRVICSETGAWGSHFSVRVWTGSKT